MSSGVSSQQVKDDPMDRGHSGQGVVDIRLNTFALIPDQELELDRSTDGMASDTSVLCPQRCQRSSSSHDHTAQLCEPNLLVDDHCSSLFHHP
jgi:hypothetical protein